MAKWQSFLREKKTKKKRVNGRERERDCASVCDGGGKRERESISEILIYF